ncbi:unnamed protein product [Nyctereutes procyonoides]|uniref:(raccoon dog) hypothetical protein n=1 Tax=Nyctereutes procyonoides TaxID=34880 RepID=A0A811YNQ5_NYCPR|nr:unnamed protein product [Nyctereutes procyonoides]
MNPQCARCGKVVYPTEKVNCLDKYWHKGCFHCEVCKMALNMNNYKGYEKKPYCNVKYKRDFEESKGRGFSIVTDTPELQRLKRTQEQISNVKYKEEYEKNKGKSMLEFVETPSYQASKEAQKMQSEQSHSQGYGYMHQTSLSSMRSMQHSPNLRTYRAMYDYSAQDEDEVSFRDGDYIVNVQPIDDGWMYGTVQRTGKTGMLPANYIEFVN